MSDVKLDQKTKKGSKQAQIILTSQKTEYSLLRMIAVVTALTTLGIFGRAAFQFIPSVEPLTPLAILSGFMFGPIAGFISGASGFFLSNFLVWGGQGPWTIFQCFGAGVAGFVGGMFGVVNKSRWKILLATLLGITLFELIVTTGNGLLFSFFGFSALLIYFVTSLPFSLVHIASSIGFSMFFYEFKERVKKLKGGKLIEQEILGFRSADSDSDEHGNRFVPFFYSKRTAGEDKNKSEGRSWPIKRKFRHNSK
jgi:hypothetical protein